MPGCAALKASATLLLDLDLLRRVAGAEAAVPADDDVARLGLRSRWRAAGSATGVALERRPTRRARPLAGCRSTAPRSPRPRPRLTALGSSCSSCRRATSSARIASRTARRPRSALHVVLLPCSDYRVTVGHVDPRASRSSCCVRRHPAQSRSDRPPAPRSSASDRRGRSVRPNSTGRPSAVDAMPSMSRAGVRRLAVQQPGLASAQQDRLEASRARATRVAVALGRAGRTASRARGPTPAGPGNRSAGRWTCSSRSGSPSASAQALEVQRRASPSSSAERGGDRPRRPTPGGPRSAASRGRGRAAASPR